MKLKLAVAAVAFAAIAPVANAAVEPSFNDNAPISATSTVRSGSTVKAAPQPSFNDNAPIAEAATSTAIAEGGQPAPSFNG
jgi:hypothetical protein